MTDLELTRLCAEAMGFEVQGECHDEIGFLFLDIAPEGDTVTEYKPLHDDAQAMALIKKFPMFIEHPDISKDGTWHVESIEIINGICPDVYAADLNRAIVECVAHMQKERFSKGEDFV